MKLIDMDELVNEIQELKEDLAYNLDCATEMDDTYMANSIHNQMSILQRILGRVRSQEVVSQWIPVSERLPECDDYYICSTKVGGCVYVTILQYISEQDELDDLNGEVGFYDLDSHYDYVYGCYSKDVIAWMPLPEVYKEEEQ